MPRGLAIVTPEDHEGEHGPGMSTASPEWAELTAACTAAWEQEAAVMVAAWAAAEDRKRQTTATGKAGRLVRAISRR